MSFLKGFQTFQSNLWKATISTSTANNAPTRFLACATLSSSSSSSKPFSPFSKSIGGVAAFSLFGFTFGSNSSNANSSASGAVGSGSSSSQSSSLLREKSPAAFRKQPTTLIFVSSEKVSQAELRETRDKWYNWIGYFREAGFDCLDIHLNVSDSVKAECDSIEKESKVLGDELSSQIALASLQRQPLIFARTSSSQMIKSLFDSNSRTHAQPSGVVLVAGQGQVRSSISEFPKKLLVAVISSDPSVEKEISSSSGNAQFVNADGDVDGEKAFREVERWMTRNGFA